MQLCKTLFLISTYENKSIVIFLAPSSEKRSEPNEATWQVFIFNAIGY